MLPLTCGSCTLVLALRWGTGFAGSCPFHLLVLRWGCGFVESCTLPLTCASLRNWLRLIMHMSKLSEASINRSKTSGFLDMFWRELRMPNGSRYCVFMITCSNTRSTLCLFILHLWVQQFCDLHFFLIVPWPTRSRESFKESFYMIAWVRLLYIAPAAWIQNFDGDGI